jgi:hypothetical protein
VSVWERLSVHPFSLGSPGVTIISSWIDALGRLGFMIIFSTALVLIILIGFPCRKRTGRPRSRTQKVVPRASGLRV